MEYPPDIAEAKSRLYRAAWREFGVSVIVGAVCGGLFYACLWFVRRDAVLPQVGPGGVRAVTGSSSDVALAGALGLGILALAYFARLRLRPAWEAFGAVGGRTWMSASNVMGFDVLCERKPMGRYNGMLAVCAVLSLLSLWTTVYCRVEFTPAGVAHFKPFTTTRLAYAEVAAVWWIPEGWRSPRLSVRGPGFVMESVAGDRVSVRSESFAGADVRPLAEFVAARGCGKLSDPGDLVAR